MDRFLRNGLFLRLMALVMAIALWFSVNSSTDPTTAGTSSLTNLSRVFEARPVTVTTAPGYVVTAMSENHATITVHGSPFDIAEAEAQSFTLKAVADASKLGVGRHTVSLSTNLTSGLQGDVSPKTISVVIERKVNRLVGVTVSITGLPPSGYAVGQAKASPGSVTVSGPESAVDSVKVVDAEVDVASMQTTTSESVRLRALDATGKPIAVTLSPDNVKVNVPVGAVQGSVPLRFVPSGWPEQGYAVASITSEASSVFLYGDPIANSLISEFSIPVDVTGLDRDVSLSEKPSLPSGIVAMQPEQIDIRVHIVSSTQGTFDSIPVTLENVPKGTNAAIVGNDKVTVTLEGAPEQLKALTVSRIHAVADLGTLSTGTSTASLQIKVDSPFVRVLSQSLSAVSVRVSKTAS